MLKPFSSWLGLLVCGTAAAAARFHSPEASMYSESEAYFSLSRSLPIAISRASGVETQYAQQRQNSEVRTRRH